MPCSQYKSPRQRRLCYLTKEWTDWSKVRRPAKKPRRAKSARAKRGRS